MAKEQEAAATGSTGGSAPQSLEALQAELTRQQEANRVLNGRLRAMSREKPAAAAASAAASPAAVAEEDAADLEQLDPAVRRVLDARDARLRKEVREETLAEVNGRFQGQALQTQEQAIDSTAAQLAQELGYDVAFVRRLLFSYTIDLDPTGQNLAAVQQAAGSVKAELPKKQAAADAAAELEKKNKDNEKDIPPVVGGMAAPAGTAGRTPTSEDIKAADTPEKKKSALAGKIAGGARAAGIKVK